MGETEEHVTPPVGDLTFTFLYAQVQGHAAHSHYPKASPLERSAVWVGLAATAVGLLVAGLSPSYVPPERALGILKLCLLMECSGFLLAFVLMLRREGRQYIKPRLTHAEEMDGEFAYWRTLVEQLRSFPQHQREQRMRFADERRKAMNERMGLVYGGLQKLGPFPILAALYLQFKDWKWGAWAGAFDVNPVAGLLIVGLVALYVLGWVLIGMRTRLDTYVALLEASLKD